MVSENNIGPPPPRRFRIVQNETVQFLCGDVLEKLAGLQDQSVQCGATSPPFFGQRDYKIPPTDWPEVTYSPMQGLPPVTVPPMRCCLGVNGG